MNDIYVNICNGSKFNLTGQLITDTEIINKIKTNILGYFPNKKYNTFPGALPISIERKHFEKIKKFPYYICLKLDGTRFFMYIYSNILYMVNRKFEIYKMCEILIDDCLFDGELIHTNKWEFVIHDTIVIYGTNVSYCNLTQRLEHIDEFLTDNEKHMTYIQFEIKNKKFFKFQKNEISALKNYIKENGAKIDGIILTPTLLPICSGCQTTLYKWKPPTSHTVDFKIKIEDNYIKAFVYDNVDKLYAMMEENSKEGITFKNALNFKSEDIVECSYSRDTDAFTPLFVRHDKEHPNSLNTVERTLFNISENILLSDIISLMNTINLN